MQSSIIASVLFVIGFIGLYATFYMLQKSYKTQNCIVWLVLDLVTVLCFITLIGGIMSIVRIPVNLWSIGIVLLITAIGLGLYIHKTKKIQKYYFKVYDLIYVLFFAVVIFAICYAKVAPDIHMSFYNSDSAVHFKNTMRVVRTGQISVMYMSELINSLFIEVFMPFMLEVNLYKVFIIMDIIFLILEIIVFMVVTREYLDSFALKVIGLVIGLLYFGGYPFNSYLYDFLYWGIGVMIIIYLLYFVRLYQRNELDKRYVVIAMMMACNAVTQCYMLFGPVTYVAVFVTLIMIRKQSGKLMTWENVKLALAVFSVPTILSIYFCYFMFLRKQSMSVGDVISINGGIYTELYINFIWMIPFVIYEFIMMIKKKKIDELMICLIMFGLMAVTCCGLVFKGKVSSYYFYKMYYPLWALCFMITVRAISQIWCTARELFIGMACTFVFVAIMSFSGIENKLLNSETDIVRENKSLAVLDIYNFNKLVYQQLCPSMPNQFLEAFNYVIQEFDDEDVPMVTSIELYKFCYWYEGITGYDCSQYYGWENDIDTICKRMEGNGVKHFVVILDSAMWYDNHEIFKNNYDVEYWDGTVAIFSMK